MPCFEFLCQCGWAGEEFLSKWDNPNPTCPACGAAPERLMSRFGVPFNGSIRKYNDPRRENAEMDGFWAYKRKSSISGQAEPIFLDSMQAVKEYNRAEGLAPPGEVPLNSTISADGKRIISNGMPGQWAGCSVRDLVPSGVWEMTKSRTALNGNTPAPVASGPPCTIEAVDASLMSKFEAEAGSAEGVR